jgi:subtilisin family serine protease
MKNYITNISKGAILGLLAGGLALYSCKRETVENKTEANPSMVDLANPQKSISGRYIVIYKDGQSADRLQNANQRLTAAGLSKLSEEMTTVHSGAVSAMVSNIAKDQLEELKKDPNVDYVEEDQTIALSIATTGTALSLPTQYTPWGVKNVGGAKDGTGKRVWIIDSGVELDHPDLTVDKTLSKSFLTSSSGGNWSSATDEYGHGTQVAGIVAAKNNTFGVVGVAAGATVVSVRVLNQYGSGTLSGLINGVNYVYTNASAGDACNISIGAGLSSALNSAVTKLGAKGVFVSIASGNSNCNCTSCSPASVNATNVYTVSGMDSLGVWVTNSNYGSPVDYCMPGKYITSTYKGHTYKNGSGTSFAAPHLAGVLLMTGGKPKYTTYVKNDPDLSPAPIGHERPRP